MKPLPFTPRWSLRLLAALSLLGTTMSPVEAAPANQPAAVAAASSDYHLGYGDALTVTVVGQPTLSIEGQPIRPDGRISLPLLQEVLIKGKTVAEVTEALTKAFRPYLNSPQVVVSVARFRPLRITLIGQVMRPGTLNFEEPPTLVEALAQAGGLTERGARDKIKVLGPAGAVHLYNLDRLLLNEEEQPRLQEGSLIEVGEVWGPDWYRIIPLTASLITAGAFLVRR